MLKVKIDRLLIRMGLKKRPMQFPKVGTRTFTLDYSKKWDMEDVKNIMKHQGLVFEVENSERGRAVLEPLKHILTQIDLKIK